MKCPCCLSESNRVIDTRKYDACNCRIRECDSCGTTWRTYEMHEKAVKVVENPPKTVLIT